MSIKKILLTIFISLICSVSYGEENLKSIGKFKDWESFTLLQNGNKVCFAQSIPVVRAPKKLKSGKKSYDLFSKGKFAWVVDDKDEKKLIVTMKKASRLMIVGNTNKGDQTTDHYSMMGFTKAYNTAKKSCS